MNMNMKPTTLTDDELTSVIGGSGIPDGRVGNLRNTLTNTVMNTTSEEHSETPPPAVPPEKHNLGFM